MILSSLFGVASALMPVADVRIGDDGNTARVEVICAGPCDAEPLDDLSFLVIAASADFTADVRMKSRYIREVSMRSTRNGAALSVQTAKVPTAVFASQCGKRRLCFDYEFGADRPAPSPRQASVEEIGNDLERLLARTGLQQISDSDVTSAAEADTGCQAAETALALDAWNLFAYRTVAMCRAKAGAPEEAARYMARLDAFSSAGSGPVRSRVAGVSALR